MSNPMFSIIIPAYNAEKHIRRLLDSIKSQSYKDYELIVICDNCTDSTAEVACEYIRPNTGDCVYQVHFGRDGLCRDYGICHAKGDWILFADDDDWFLHEFCFEQLAEFITQNAGAADVIGFGYIFRTKGYIRPSEYNLFRPRVDHVWSSAWRRDAIRDAQFGDAVFCSDTYFMRDMKQRCGSFVLFNMPLYYYNFMRPGSQTDLFCRGIIKQSIVAE